MPNPFTARMFQANTSKRRPEAIVPVVEEYAGTNHPYRGIQNHGVDVRPDYQQPADWEDGRPAPLDTPPDPPQPVPVYIVNEASRELRRFRTIGAYAGGTTFGQARMIVGQDEERSNVRIANPSEDAIVWISDTPETANSLNGFPVFPREERVLTAHIAVYASVDAADDLPIYVLVEYASAVA